MVRTTPIVAAVLLGFALVPWARAAETEVRVFNVTVDGKDAGKYRMAFTKESDGTLTVSCDAHVKVKVAFVTAYHYDYTGTEAWKDGRLVSLRSVSDDDGKKFDVTATATEKGLSVKVNGREKAVAADAYLTTACCLPDARRRGGDLPLMEADNGQEIKGKIQEVATGTLNVGGTDVAVTRYRLKSLVEHEIWYDRSDRMVRQEWTEDGHKTVLQLTERQEIGRPAGQVSLVRKAGNWLPMRRMQQPGDQGCPL